MIEQYSYGIPVKANADHNVIEKYKQMAADEIRADLQPKRSKMVTILMNTDHNLNIGTIIRSNNAFLGRSVYVVGRKRYNHVPAVGTTHLETVYHADCLEEVIDKLHQEQYIVYAVDNLMDYKPKNIWDAKIVPSAAFVYGNESEGLTDSEIKLCDDMLYVGMYGSVRSLNLACAASIIMAEYTKRYGRWIG